VGVISRIDPASPIGLALGGGGARGLAHVGVLKVLEREQIPVGAIAGTSMGALIGAAYAAGFPVARIETEILRLARLTSLIRLADRIPTLRGLFSGNRMKQYLGEQFGTRKRFEDLPIPFALTTVDLFSGRELVIQEGPLVPALRATMSIPGVYEPVELGPYRLIDGGVLNNVPCDIARHLGGVKLIAVDVLPDFTRNVPGEPIQVPNLTPPLFPVVARDVWQVIFLAISALTEKRLREANPEVILRPTLAADITLLFGFTRAEEIIAAGEEAAERALSQIRTLL
jgi:NTE family protein